MAALDGGYDSDVVVEPQVASVPGPEATGCKTDPQWWVGSLRQFFGPALTDWIDKAEPLKVFSACTGLWTEGFAYQAFSISEPVVSPIGLSGCPMGSNN